MPSHAERAAHNSTTPNRFVTAGSCCGPKAVKLQLTLFLGVNPRFGESFSRLPTVDSAIFMEPSSAPAAPGGFSEPLDQCLGAVNLREPGFDVTQPFVVRLAGLLSKRQLSVFKLPK